MFEAVWGGGTATSGQSCGRSVRSCWDFVGFSCPEPGSAIPRCICARVESGAMLVMAARSLLASATENESMNALVPL